MRATAVMLLVVAQLAMGTHYFYAKFTQTNDPNMPNGIATGEIWNKWDSAGSANNRMLVRYNSPAVVNELVHQGKQIRYRYCDNFNSCDAETYKVQVQPFHPGAYGSPTTVTLNGKQCTRYSKSSGNDQIKQIFVCSGVVTRAVYHNGRTLDFTSVSTAAFSKNMEPSSSCPKPRCTKVINLLFNLDNSGSIDSSEFKTLRSYVNSIIDRFEIASDATNVAVVFFNTKGYDMVPGLSSSVTAIKNAVKKSQKGGNTCAGSGLRTAWSIVQNSSSSRKAKKPTNIFVTITDGNDYKCPTNNVAGTVMKDLKSKGTFIAIGVGNGISTSALKKISNGDGYWFKSPNFNDLKNKVDALVATSCQDLPSINPCGTSCKGFCTCNKKCVCPTCRGDFCTIYKCSSGTAGCTGTARNCNDNNVCTINDACNEGQRKCTYGNLAMPAGWAENKCIDKTCHKTNGWVSTPHVCPSYTAQDPCNISYCDKAKGCMTKTKDCNDNNLCTKDSCKKGYGCVNERITCPNTGNVCADHYCDESDGKCKFTRWNVAVRCDDKNACTDDFCDDNTGCFHTEHKCPDDGKEYDNCVIHKCNKDRGCYTVEITGCSACATKTCTGNDKCKNYFCEEVNGEAVCKEESKDIDDGNACTTDSCDPATGAISHVEKVCTPSDMCHTSTCNPATGECVEEEITCTSSDPCMDAKCDPAIGCYTEPHCKPKTCKDVSCNADSVSGEATCVEKDRDCSDDNVCTTDSCDPEKDACVREPIVCEPRNKCEVPVVCDPIEGCIFEKVVCSATRPCGWAECVPDQGCVEHYPCDDNDWCTEDSCQEVSLTAEEYEQLIEKNDPYTFNYVQYTPEESANGDEEPTEQIAWTATQCQFVEKKTEPGLFGDCYDPVCDSNKKEFVKRVREGALVDACGACMIEVGENYDDTACFAGATNEEFAATLGAVAVAGIIIAAIIGIAVVSISATAGTKELLNRSAAAQTTSVQNNPFYKENANEMSNPTFEGNDGFNF